MRVRITDGTHEVEIEARTRGRHGMRQMEATAYRLLARLRRPTPSSESTNDDGQPFGFTADLDRVSLDSSIERAEPVRDPLDHDDGYDDEDDHA